VTNGEALESRLRAALSPSHLEIVDDGARHIGHAGAAGGAGHFSCVIVADAFRGLSTVERHRAVYAAVGDLMPRRIHALALKTFSPEEWRGV
jgi:BolA family transcriptional regulator, general stress-responsive regulator